MKLSIVLSAQPASFSALAYKGDIEENVKKLKQLGYDGVELAVRDPNELDTSLIKSIIRENSLTVPAIGTGQAFGEEGLSFTHDDPIVRRKAIYRIKDHISFAKEFNSIVIVGLIRGKVDNPAQQENVKRNLISAIGECASFASETKIAIEPINRYETNLLNTVQETIDIIEEIGKPNVGLLLDSFHMNIEEPSIEESIINAKDKLFHFHVADSNRWFPGAGHLDFKEIIEILRRIKYKGFLSAEILPLPDPDTAAENTISFMKKILQT